MAYASRALNDTEQNYAQIKKEMLAILFGLTKFERFTLGMKVMVEYDYKPLETSQKTSNKCTENFFKLLPFLRNSLKICRKNIAKYTG